MTMAPGNDTKLPLTSRDVHAERLTQFRELFPEAFTEGKTDLKRLAQLLGDAATDAPERYGLSWAGKSEAIRAIQITSPGTLRPCVTTNAETDGRYHSKWLTMMYHAGDAARLGRTETQRRDLPGHRFRR